MCKYFYNPLCWRCVHISTIKESDVQHGSPDDKDRDSQQGVLKDQDRDNQQGALKDEEQKEKEQEEEEEETEEEAELLLDSSPSSDIGCPAPLLPVVLEAPPTSSSSSSDGLGEALWSPG